MHERTVDDQSLARRIDLARRGRHRRLEELHLVRVLARVSVRRVTPRPPRSLQPRPRRVEGRVARANTVLHLQLYPWSVSTM